MLAYLKNLTPAQQFAITLAILSALGGSITQLNDIVGPVAAKWIVTTSTFFSTMLSAILVSLTSQGSQIKAVSAMPGVSSITVNENANQTLAAIAVAPTSKVEAAPSAQKIVEATAKGPQV